MGRKESWNLAKGEIQARVSSHLSHTVPNSEETEEKKISYSSQLVFGEAQSRQKQMDAHWLSRVPIKSHKQTQQNRSDLSKISEALKEELHTESEQGEKWIWGRAAGCVGYAVNQSITLWHCLEASRS